MSPQRLALAGFLAAVIAVVCVPSNVSATAPSPTPTTTPPAATFTPHHPITITAYKYLGEWGGQCWQFVRNVVKEATGLEMGFDYRQGYFDAGAVEVTIAQAQEGDVIQIADDAYTAPDADYNGLHTFIITENLGNGVFNGIDSNSDWSETVLERKGYDIYDVVAEKNRQNPDRTLEFHIYRFPVAGYQLPPPPPPKTQPPVTLEAGDSARVSTPGDTLNLRSKPGGNVIARLPDGTLVTIVTGDPVQSGDTAWLKVSTPLGTGWVASKYLSPADGSASGGESRPIMSFTTRIAQLAAD